MNLAIDAAAMNFSWVEAGRIAGCRGPKTQNDLRFLSSQGVRALVRLAYEQESGLSSAHVFTSGLEDFYDPVDDFTAPSQDLIDRAISFMGNAVRSGKPVAVSCGAGYGRTGTVLACYFVSA